MLSPWLHERQVYDKEVILVRNQIVVKNGFVFDPVNKIDGERMDIFVRGGKIVEKLNGEIFQEIDASGMVVMAGGVDIHNPF
jgi:formylmethanofuran dehydrogenase subunit A